MTLKTEPTTRREPLSRERVLRAAIELADRDGLEALSMRRVGQALGVEAMSLYNHVANKEDLLDGMVETVVSEIDPPPSGPDWKSTMRARILSARRAMLRHRWASEAIVSRQNMTPAMLRVHGLDGRDLPRRRFLGRSDPPRNPRPGQPSTGLHAGAVRRLGAAERRSRDDGDDARQMAEAISVHHRDRQQVAHDEATVVGSGCDDQFEFEFALDLILDGLERFAQSRKRRRPKRKITSCLRRGIGPRRRLA